MRAWALCVMLAWLGCSLVACSTDRRSSRHRDPGALVVAEASDVQALDPARVTDSESIEVGTLMFEGLVKWKPGTTDVTEGLATQWSVSTDGRVWTFQLRAGVTFHDGTPLDAAAVVFSFERLLDPKHPYYLAKPDASYRRALMKGITKVVATGTHSVEIHTARPYAPLLGDLALYPIVSPAGVRAFGDAFREHPVGTGPFQFVEWNRGEQVVVKRNEHYWGQRAAIERIVFRVIVDARQRLVELESGSVDLATAVLPDEQPFVELHPDLVLYTTPGNDVSYLAFNTQKPPFDDPLVRRAASYAINKAPIVKLAFQGRAVPADGPLPPTQWGYHEPRSRYAYDLAKARELLAQSTSFDPDAVYKLNALSTPRPYFSQPERVARFLQSALAQIGIKTELVLQPYAEHKKSVEAGAHDLAIFGWVGDTGDPDNFLYVLFHSDNAVPPTAQNIAFFRDAAVDDLLARAQSTSDVETRTGLYASVQERIADAAPWVPLAHSEFVVAARVELENVVLSPLGHPVYALIARREVPR